MYYVKLDILYHGIKYITNTQRNPWKFSADRMNNDLLESLSQSLQRIDTCISRSENLLARLERYHSEADEFSFRTRRSIASSSPFGELRPGRVPIPDNNHASQRAAFASKFLDPLRLRVDWSGSEREVLVEALTSFLGQGDQGADSIDWVSVQRECVEIDPKFARSHLSCKIEYIYAIQCAGVRAWTAEEDEKLSQLVTENGGSNWKQISVAMNRPVSACFSRCYSSLHPVLVPVEFSAEDDERLREIVALIGESSWPQVAADLGTGHTERQCFTRWNKTLKPDIRGGRWNPVLDKKLRAAVAIFGQGNWAQIAKHVDGKTDRKCRERFMDKFQAGLKTKAEWDSDEDEMLIQAVRDHGVGKWARIAKEISGRTDIMCRHRLKKLAEDGTHDELKEQYEEQLESKRNAKRARSRPSTPSSQPH